MKHSVVNIGRFLLCLLSVYFDCITAMEMDIKAVHGQNESSEYYVKFRLFVYNSILLTDLQFKLIVLDIVLLFTILYWIRLIRCIQLESVKS